MAHGEIPPQEQSCQRNRHHRADPRPPPRQYERGDQDEHGDQVEQQVNKGSPQALSFFEDIQREEADEERKGDGQDPRGPEYRYTRFFVYPNPPFPTIIMRQAGGGLR